MKENTLWVGMDVSKGRAEVGVLDNDMKKVSATKQFMDTMEGRKKLCLWLEEKIIKTGAERLEIGMEPTGGYEVHFYRSVKEWEFKCAKKIRFLPTILVKSHQKAKGQRTKTDRTCAISLAESMASYPDLEIMPLQGEERALRRIVRRIEVQTKRLQMLENEFHEALYESMPFMIVHLNEGIPMWVLELVGKYPSAREIAHGGKRIKIPFAKSEKLKSIVGQAKESWKELPYDEFTRYDLKKLVEDIKWIRRKEKIDKDNLEKMIKPLESNTVLKWLRTIPEIGAYSSAVLYTELFLGDRKYETPDKINKFVGLDLLEVSSGDRAGEMRISKRGSGSVRRILYLFSWRLIQKVPVFKEYYAKKVKNNGGYKNKAIVAVMKKVLRVIWALCTYERVYEGDHESKWKESHNIVCESQSKYGKGVKEVLKLSKMEIENAPVSKRFMKKVKAATGHKLAICQTQVVTVESSPFPDSQIK